VVLRAALTLPFLDNSDTVSSAIEGDCRSGSGGVSEMYRIGML
jgi:hypothetical protein